MVAIQPIHVLMAIAGLLGLAFPWLLAWTIGPMLPARIAESLANVYLRIGFNTAGDKLLNYTDAGIYEIEAADRESPDDGQDFDASHWTVFNGAWFAVGYDRVDDAFGGYARDIDPEAVAGTAVAGSKHFADITRGAWDTFVDLSRRYKNADIHVLAGEFLSRFQGIGTTAETRRAQEAAMHDEAGDTNSHSALVRWGGAVTFFVLSSLLTLVLL